MCKKALQDEAMSNTAYVEEASNWALRLTQAETRGPGDMQNAWRRLEARYGVPWRTFWALRYRRPRDLTATIFHQLREAYEAERQRQMRLLQHELEITRAITGNSHPVILAAEAVVGAPTRSESEEDAGAAGQTEG